MAEIIRSRPVHGWQLSRKGLTVVAIVAGGVLGATTIAAMVALTGGFTAPAVVEAQDMQLRVNGAELRRLKGELARLQDSTNLQKTDVENATVESRRILRLASQLAELAQRASQAVKSIPDQKTAMAADAHMELVQVLREARNVAEGLTAPPSVAAPKVIQSNP